MIRRITLFKRILRRDSHLVLKLKSCTRRKASSLFMTGTMKTTTLSINCLGIVLDSILIGPKVG